MVTSAKSKRRRPYSFTVTQKKKADWKAGLMDRVRQYVHQYDRLIVFKFVNSRTDLINALRRRWRKSRFFLGRNKVLQVGLGRTPEEEIGTNLHKISEQLVDQRGILFTNESLEDILEFFNSHRVKVHSRTGSLAPSTVELEAGMLDMFGHGQEPYLRKLGLHTRLRPVDMGTGVPELLVPYTVATKGKRLKANEATLLRLLGYKDSDFYVRFYCMWDRNTEEFNKFVLSNKMMKLKANKTGDSGDNSDDDDDDDDEQEMTSEDEDDDDEEDMDEDVCEAGVKDTEKSDQCEMDD